MNLQGLVWLSMGLVIYIFLCCRAAPAEGTSKVTTETSETRKVYCGRYLMDTLSTVCQGFYHTVRPATLRRGRNKRSTTSNPLSQTFPPSTPEESRHWRRRRGVYNECCESACTFEVLKSYCGQPTTTATPIPSR